MINNFSLIILCITVTAQGLIQFKINLTANKWMKRHGEEILKIYDHLIDLRKEIVSKNLEVHSRVAALENELIMLKRKIRGEA